MQAGCTQDASSRSLLDVQHEELSNAFASFRQAAGHLERSYNQLQLEVERLRHELEDTNRDLARSLEQNHSMRQYLDRILEGLPCGVLVVDENDLARLANSEAHRLLTMENGAIHRDQPLPPAVQDVVSRCQKANEEQEFMCKTAASGECWVAVRRARVTEGNDQHTIYILRDISEQKRLEGDRQRSRRQEALAEMSAVLAHEIRNPLGSLELFTGLLADDTHSSAEERNQWIVQLQAGLRTLSATVNNVLHFHSLPPPSLVPCDLGEVLDRAFEFLAPLGRQSGVSIQISNALHGITRPADPHRLQQVLLNLALNALRFTPSGGRVLFAGKSECESSRLVAEIQVSDTGGGIAPDHLNKIFQPGFTTRAGSPGLGLAVCRKIVEQHGGEIRASSLPAQGATFTLRFPLP